MDKMTLLTRTLEGFQRRVVGQRRKQREEVRVVQGSVCESHSDEPQFVKGNSCEHDTLEVELYQRSVALEKTCETFHRFVTKIDCCNENRTEASE